jgi:mono/diheme cytochrome c family protein
MSSEAVKGAALFAESGCLSCHTYRGTGSLNLGARDLTHEGGRRSHDVLNRYIANPGAFGDNVMPAYSRAFGPRQLHEVAAFLSESR